MAKVLKEEEINLFAYRRAECRQGFKHRIHV